MTVYNWLGGSNNSASDPNSWSPSGTPQPGDTLNLNVVATVNDYNNGLNWGTVMLNGNGSDASQSAFAINVWGENAFNLMDENPGFSVGPATISIEANSYWVGSFISQPGSGRLVVQGTGDFYNGQSYIGSNAVINAPVEGSGTFALLPTHPAGARLEFMQSVSAGQSVGINGYSEYPGSPFGTVQVDVPSDFHASIRMGFGELVLETVQADSYNIQNDLLTLYNGGSVADQVSLTMGSQGPNGPQNFGVTQTGFGVVIHADGANGVGRAWASGTALGLAQV